MRIAIIGSGPSGLISAKHCLSSVNKLEYLHVYERLAYLGGAWCEDREKTILYDNLRTNLPKQVMEFDGLKYEDNEPSSFISSKTVTKYVNKFADKFQLKKYIKFETNVDKVSRINGEWNVTSYHIPTSQKITEIYDVVFVCNGHYSVPSVPYFKGLDRFKGDCKDFPVIHSMKYRKPNQYSNLDVLVIGAGPSGVDIAIDVSAAAKLVYLSHHSKELSTVRFPDNVIHEPDIDYFSESQVTFIDGTSCKIDRVILATGFKYQLDFLADSCEVHVEDYGYVTPLYKQLVSIAHPSMVFIGLPFRTFIFPLIEMQVKCVIQLLNENANLPSTEEMNSERKASEELCHQKGIPKRKYHSLSNMVRQYLTEIAKLGNLDFLEEVIFSIYEKCVELRKKNLTTYRNYKFLIIDSESYELEQVVI